LAALQESLPSFLALFRQLAKAHQIYILAGTFPVRVAEGFRNRAHLLSPAGAMVFQDKLQITQFEAEQMLMRPGDKIKVFDTAFGKLGVSICYDIQFPLLARYQAEAEAKLLLVPSSADSLAGYHRVRIGCQARALENQCYVIQAATVACVHQAQTTEIRTGAAAVYTPLDRNFPNEGILALGKINEPQWVFADLDLEAIDKVRQKGDVLNYQDWNGQKRLEGAKVEQARSIGSYRAHL
jgi:predicted amidohydrolase